MCNHFKNCIWFHKQFASPLQGFTAFSTVISTGFLNQERCGTVEHWCVRMQPLKMGEKRKITQVYINLAPSSMKANSCLVKSRKVSPCPRMGKGYTWTDAAPHLVWKDKNPFKCISPAGRQWWHRTPGGCECSSGLSQVQVNWNSIPTHKTEVFSTNLASQLLALSAGRH